MRPGPAVIRTATQCAFDNRRNYRNRRRLPAAQFLLPPENGTNRSTRPFVTIRNAMILAATVVGLLLLPVITARYMGGLDGAIL